MRALLLLLALVAAGCASHAPDHALQVGQHADPASRPLQSCADEIRMLHGALMDVLAVAKCGTRSPPQAPEMQPVPAAPNLDGNKNTAATTQVDEICAIVLAEIPDVSARLAHAAPDRQAVVSESGRGAAQVEPPRQADALDEEQLPLQRTELQRHPLEAGPQTSALAGLTGQEAKLETEKWPAGENDKAIHDQSKTSATMPRGGVDAALTAEIFAGIARRGHHTVPSSALAAAKEAMLVKGVASEAIVQLLLAANRERRRREEEVFAAARQTRNDGDTATQVEARRRESTKRQRKAFRESRAIQRLAGEKQVLDHIRAMRCPGTAPAVRGSGVGNDDNDIKNGKNGGGDGGDGGVDDLINDEDNDHDNGESVQAYYDVGKRASCSFLTAEIAKLAAMSGKGRRRLAACPTFLEASHEDLKNQGAGLEDGVNYVEVSCDMDASSQSSLTVGGGQTYKIAKHPTRREIGGNDRKATNQEQRRHFLLGGSPGFPAGAEGGFSTGGGGVVYVWPGTFSICLQEILDIREEWYPGRNIYHAFKGNTTAVSRLLYDVGNLVLFNAIRTFVGGGAVFYCSPIYDMHFSRMFYSTGAYIYA